LDDPSSVQNKEEAFEEYAESGREVRRGSDRTNLFDDGGMGARFERRLVCVNQHHGLPWETPLQTVKQSLTGPVAAGIRWSVSPLGHGAGFWR